MAHMPPFTTGNSPCSMAAGEVARAMEGGGTVGGTPGTEDNDEISEAEVELRVQQMIPLVAQQIARMEVTSPEVVRVTPAYRAFEKGAVAFRKECAGDFYFKSEKSEKISTFWSHSWQGGHWKLS